MKQKSFTALIAIIAAVIVGCSEDTYEAITLEVEAEDAVVLSASIGNLTTTRTDPVTSETAFSSGDTIGLSNDSANFINYTYSGSAWSVVNSDDYVTWRKQDDGKYHFNAYYPAVDGITYSYFALPSDQSTLSGIAAADYMKCDTMFSEIEANNKLSLKMNRKMALVKISIDGNITDYVGTSAKLDSVKVNSPHRYYANDSAYSYPIMVSTYKSGEDYYAIIIPDNDGLADSTFINFHLSDTYNDSARTTVATIATSVGIPAMKGGYKYEYKAKVYWDRVDISVDVTEWTTGTITYSGGQTSKFAEYNFDTDDADGEIDGSSFAAYLETLDSTYGYTLSLYGTMTETHYGKLLSFVASTGKGANANMTLDLSNTKFSDNVILEYDPSGPPYQAHAKTTTGVVSIIFPSTENSSSSKTRSSSSGFTLGTNALVKYYNLKNESSFKNIGSIDSLKDRALFICFNLESISLPNVTGCGSQVFACDSALKVVRLPKLKYVSNMLFYSDVKMDSIFVDEADSIGKQSFVGIGKSFYLYSPKVKAVGENAFTDNISDTTTTSNGIKSVSLPIVERIHSKAFYNCDAIDTLYFHKCTSVPKVYHKRTLETQNNYGEAYTFYNDDAFQAADISKTIVVVTDSLYDKWKKAFTSSSYPYSTAESIDYMSDAFWYFNGFTNTDNILKASECNTLPPD